MLPGGDGDDSTTDRFRRAGFFPVAAPDAAPQRRELRRTPSEAIFEAGEALREDVGSALFRFPRFARAAFSVSSRSNASTLVSRASSASSLGSPSSMKSSELDPGGEESSDIFSMFTIPCFARRS